MAIVSNEFNSLPKALFEKDRAAFARVMSSIAKSSPDAVERFEYKVGGDTWVVYDAPSFKMTLNATSEDYRCFFDKTTGYNCRFGKRVEDDPSWCPLGPEILDLEISVGGCPPVKGSSNCRYCYKNNTNRQPENMSFETFKKIFDSFPKNLSQIAFGITGLKTNPAMPAMFRYCRENGTIPNVTTVGADMDDETLDALCRWCGAVAVSCYTGAKELCYGTIKRIKDYASEKYKRDMHVNMHIVLSKDNLEHVREVLADIAAGKVEGLRSVVLLRIKPVGRASNMDCSVPLDVYRELVSFCLEKNISFGFDSCSATPVMDVLKEMGKPELCASAEPCESGKLSSYINVKGEYWHCSFCERSDFVKPVNVLDYESATEWWNSDEMNRVRNFKDWACKSCPVFNLD